MFFYILFILLPAYISFRFKPKSPGKFFSFKNPKPNAGIAYIDSQKHGETISYKLLFGKYLIGGCVW